MECVPGNLPGDLVLCTWAASAQHVPKSQICRKKTSAQHKPHCLYKHCRHSEALFSLRKSFISASEWFIIQVPRLQPRPALPAGLSKNPILGWPWELFLTEGSGVSLGLTAGGVRPMVSSLMWLTVEQKRCALNHQWIGCGLSAAPRPAGLRPGDQSHQHSHNGNWIECSQRGRVNTQARTSHLPEGPEAEERMEVKG